MFGAQHGLLGRLRRLAQRFHRAVDLAEIDLAVAAQKIDGRIAGDARQPVRGLFRILELILPLERLDESFLGQILGVGHVPTIR